MHDGNRRVLVIDDDTEVRSSLAAHFAAAAGTVLSVSQRRARGFRVAVP